MAGNGSKPVKLLHEPSSSPLDSSFQVFPPKTSQVVCFHGSVLFVIATTPNPVVDCDSGLRFREESAGISGFRKQKKECIAYGFSLFFAP